MGFADTFTVTTIAIISITVFMTNMITMETTGTVNTLLVPTMCFLHIDMPVIIITLHHHHVVHPAVHTSVAGQ
jgi:hypothetical protein